MKWQYAQTYVEALSRYHDTKTGTAILRVIFIELCRRVRVKFPKSSANIHKS